ncbi:hypothetical protein HY389_01425 [Candidatus Daviesbacteria bacterium]|nr:hypothetical protein [Candidatus Daviesbacteria bacterium]
MEIERLEFLAEAIQSEVFKGGDPVVAARLKEDSVRRNLSNRQIVPKMRLIDRSDNKAGDWSQSGNIILMTLAVGYYSIRLLVAIPGAVKNFIIGE